jgi:5-methylcytosine-specific restriction endonuclease McrA
MRDKRLTELFNRQSGFCAYCDTKMTLEIGHRHTATKDHVVPKSRGGNSNIYNLVASCYDCNQKKADKPLYQFLSEVRHG